MPDMALSRSPFLLLVTALTATATASAPPPLEPPPEPVPHPSRPKPDFSWDTIPLAFHGANRTGPYSHAEVELLATRLTPGRRARAGGRAGVPL